MGEVAMDGYSILGTAVLKDACCMLEDAEGKRTEFTENIGSAEKGESMKAGGQNRIVLVTCGSTAEARRIATAVVEGRLAACANILPSPVESVYHWKGRVEKAREVMILLKTTTKRLEELEGEVKRLHSYELPEFVVLPIVAGSRPYLRWIGENVSRGRS
jgi:periplasmic divalent cation tolerance protein